MGHLKFDNLDAYLTLNWYDVQDMLVGHHPLLMLRLIMQFDVKHNPPTKFEMGDQLSNAEHLCRALHDIDIKVTDLAPIAREVYGITHGLTYVADDAITEIVTLAVQRGLSRGVLRRKALMDSTLLKPIKRDVPLARGANYADPDNKAFPLDTPERVKASHAYIHKYWNNNAQTGITATYNRDKFLQVHGRILTRMRRLGVDHVVRDSLDRATKSLMKKQLAQKHMSLKKAGAGAPRGGGLRDGGLGSLSPDLMDAKVLNKLKNLLQMAFTDHISFLKNYVSACDERNDNVAKSMETALDANIKEISDVIREYLVPYTPDEPQTTDEEETVGQFVKLWTEYLDAIKSMVIGGDTGNDSMAKSGLRALFLVKDKIVKYFISLLAEVAEEEELDEVWTDWVNHLQGYIEARDQDDFASSYQHLQDLKKAKDDVIKKISQWIIGRDKSGAQDIAEAKPLDLEEGDDAKDSPMMGQTRNPPAPLGEPMKTPNDIRRAASRTPDTGKSSVTPSVAFGGGAAASPAAPPAASASGSDVALQYPPGGKPARRLNETRQSPIGHRPYCEHCMPDARNGKCYAEHKK